MYGNQHQEVLGDQRDDHTYRMEVRQIMDGRWVIILVHADSRLKAIKLAADAGYSAAGGQVEQVR